VISEFVVFALALTVAGSTLGAEYIGDYVLALAFGILFQYFAIAPMRGLGLGDGLKAAAKADVISLVIVLLVIVLAGAEGDQLRGARRRGGPGRAGTR